MLFLLPDQKSAIHVIQLLNLTTLYLNTFIHQTSRSTSSFSNLIFTTVFVISSALAFSALTLLVG